MRTEKLANGEKLRRFACLSALILGGCGVALGPEDADLPPADSTFNLSTLSLGSESSRYDTTPNDFFDLAEFVNLTDEQRVIHGRISATHDVDVYDLGPVAPGDRVVITMNADDSLDGAIALFDEYGAALLVNDHRNVYLGRTAPFIDVVVRRESRACFVAVSATPGFASAGDYVLVASKSAAGGPADVPGARPDVVLLVFDGGTHVRIGSRLPVDVPAFDAANIYPAHTGQTNFMVGEIVDRVHEDYAAFDVTILSTSEGHRFESGMTRIFFGTSDEALLGVAEGVDEFNATRAQQAIVFTDTFAAFAPLGPSVSQISRAIANVASHEIGHLLGMVHTSDPVGIMDVTASLSELLQDQVFTISPIDSAVFPLGYQDAVQYLLDAVGGDPTLLLMKRFRPDHRSLTVREDADPGPARTMFRLSTCSLADH